MHYKHAILFTVLSVLLITDAHALGLGPIQTFSAFYEPFSAEIELLGVPYDELDTVEAKLASDAELAKLDIGRSHYLDTLRFEPRVSQGGRPVIRVTSKFPIRETYLDFPVEVVWPKGHLVKQYVVLLNLNK